MYSMGYNLQPYNILDRYVQPWANFNPPPETRTAMDEDNDIAFGMYMNSLREQRLSPNFMKWVQQQLPDYYQRYYGWAALPENKAGRFPDYMNQQDVYQDYNNTNPYARASVDASRPSRFNLRR